MPTTAEMKCGKWQGTFEKAPWYLSESLDNELPLKAWLGSSFLKEF